MNDKRQIPEPDACVINWPKPETRANELLYRVFVTGNKGEGRLLRFWLAVEDNECVQFIAEPGVLPFRGVGDGWLCDECTNVTWQYVFRNNIPSDFNQILESHELNPRHWRWPSCGWLKNTSDFREPPKFLVNPKAPLDDRRVFDGAENRYPVQTPKPIAVSSQIGRGAPMSSVKMDYLTQMATLDGDPLFEFRLGKGSRFPVRGSKLAKALWSIRQAGRTEVTAKELETVIRQGLSLL